MNDMSKSIRADYHLTLGKAISVLQSVSEETPVRFGGDYEGEDYPGDEMSYRGYYSDLALEPTSEPCTAGQLLERLRNALGKTYEGYKGGDFVMDAKTPLWRAEYSECGEAIIRADLHEGTLYLVCKAEDDEE